MKQTIITYVKDEPGVLNRIARHFYRLNYNINSITAGRSEIRGITRITIMCSHGDHYNQSLIQKQLEELETVLVVKDITDVPSVVREHALVKVKIEENEIDNLKELVQSYTAKIIDGDNVNCIIEATGEVDEVEQLIKQLKQYNIMEIMRSGKSAMVCVNQEEHRVEIEEMKRQKGWTTQQMSDAIS